MSKIKDENYFIIHGWMINKLGLKGTPLQVYGIIYGFSQDGESKFTGSHQYLVDFTGTSKPTILKAIDELVSKEYIIKNQNKINGVIFNEYYVNQNFTGGKETLPVVKNEDNNGKETLQGSKETLQGGSKETLPNNIYINNNSNNKINNNNSLVETPLVNDIISYLNLKAETKYKATTSKTKTLINARLQEGFTLNDFKTVIDKKVNAWKDTDMGQYLRPETLFGTKFEGYLNEKPKSFNNSNSQHTQQNKEDGYTYYTKDGMEYREKNGAIEYFYYNTWWKYETEEEKREREEKARREAEELQKEYGF